MDEHSASDSPPGKGALKKYFDSVTEHTIGSEKIPCYLIVPNAPSDDIINFLTTTLRSAGCKAPIPVAQFDGKIFIPVHVAESPEAVTALNNPHNLEFFEAKLASIREGGGRSKPQKLLPRKVSPPSQDVILELERITHVKWDTVPTENKIFYATTVPLHDAQRAFETLSRSMHLHSHEGYFIQGGKPHIAMTAITHNNFGLLRDMEPGALKRVFTPRSQENPRGRE